MMFNKNIFPSIVILRKLTHELQHMNEAGKVTHRYIAYSSYFYLSYLS